MESNEIKVLHSTDQFDVIDAAGMPGIRPKQITVVVLPFECGEDGMPVKIGIVTEKSQLRLNKEFKTLITGAAEGDDPDLLSSAKRALAAQAGYGEVDTDRWYYLGSITTDKLVMDEKPCFAVNVTDLETQGDKDFALTNVTEALELDDCYIAAVFMRMFRYIFKNNNIKKEDEQKGTEVDREEDGDAEEREVEAAGEGTEGGDV